MKTIELTFELNLYKVSCPGVWLCQDGMVSLTLYALGSSYQTCMVPPVFPLVFRDTFYFRRRFQETCTVNNIFCLLKDETIYCELVQWSATCGNKNKCIVLAQYLGALNDILFPPNLCSNEGVDLLMRRSKHFPGILAPKIEISTKVRIDEIFDKPGSIGGPKPPKILPCKCRKDVTDTARQKQVCHTPLFHRVRCIKTGNSSDPRVHSTHSLKGVCPIPYGDRCNLGCKSRSSVSAKTSHKDRCKEYHQYQVFKVATPKAEMAWLSAATYSGGEDCHYVLSRPNISFKSSEESTEKPQLESRFIDDSCQHDQIPSLLEIRRPKQKTSRLKIEPCVCDICRRYHELFHNHNRQSIV